MISKELLKQLRELESGVTPGDWVSDRYSINAGECKAFTSCRSNTDAQFIAVLRNNILPLLDEIERLQELAELGRAYVRSREKKLVTDMSKNFGKSVGGFTINGFDYEQKMYKATCDTCSRNFLLRKRFIHYKKHKYLGCKDCHMSVKKNNRILAGTKRSIFYEVGGIKNSTSGWAKILGISRQRVDQLIKRNQLSKKVLDLKLK